jgi:uridylate kinase
MSYVSPKYRVLLKLSGEILKGKSRSFFDLNYINNLCVDIQDIYNKGVQVAIVVGGGNIFRGADGCSSGIDRRVSDNIGILSTVINSLIVKDCLTNIGLKSSVKSSITVGSMCDLYNSNETLELMDRGIIPIFAAGIANPYFTTDTTSVIRALEMKCNILLKATKVDGVYTSDPGSCNDAKHFSRVSYSNILLNNFQIMDMTSIILSKDNKLPILVFRVCNSSFLRVLCGKLKCTYIK